MEEVLDQTEEILELAIEPEVKHAQRIIFLAVVAIVLILMPLIVLAFNSFPKLETLLLACALFISPLICMVLTITTTFPKIKTSPNQFRDIHLLSYSSIPFFIFVLLMTLVLTIIILDDTMGNDDSLFIIAFILLGGVLSTITYLILKSRKQNSLRKKKRNIILFGIIFIIAQLAAIGFLMEAVST